MANSIVKLSRFAVEMSLQCERCFVLQYKHKISLRSFPFTLNLAVDDLVKNEFDYYRDKGLPHPIFEQYAIDAVPFKHSKMDEWRNNFKGAYYTDIFGAYKFGGSVDDIWQKKDGELIIADTKATSKKNFNWQETYEKYDYPKAYKRQLEMYKWVFIKLGFRVSNKGYLLYFNGIKDNQFFNNSLQFEQHLIELELNDLWVESAILNAVALLKSKDLPKPSKSCDKCNYLKERWYLSQSNIEEFLDRQNTFK